MCVLSLKASTPDTNLIIMQLSELKHSETKLVFSSWGHQGG